MPATMRDVALEANVSIQTVSNVVNDRPVVAEETRQRVLATMTRLGFQPNALARSLRANRAQTIGIVFMRPERRFFVRKPYLNELLSGFADATRDTEYGLLLHSATSEHSADDIIQLYHRRRIDAVILTGVTLDEQLITMLIASQIPCVFIDVPVTGADAACVRCDFRDGAHQAMRYLIQAGHTRIGFFSGTLDMYSGRERVEGYHDILRQHGLQPAAVPAEWTREGGHQAMHDLLAAHPAITAVFAPTDPLAIGAMEVARARGIRVPQDIAIVGFNDLEMASLVSPALTTVHVPVYEMATQAIELVLARLANGHFDSTDIVLPTHLVIRQSA